jgi:hypothetical protein
LKPRIKVFQDLLITDVARDDHELTVHVLDASQSANRITFHLEDGDLARELADQVARWHEDRRPVSYVRVGDQGVLLDEREAFERAMADPLGGSFA